MFDAPAEVAPEADGSMDLAGTEIIEEVEAEVVEPTASPMPLPPLSQSTPVARFDDIDGNDELLLGAEASVEPEAPAPAPAAPTPAPASKPAGGTLFERMSGLSRGLGRGSSSDDDDEDDSGPPVTKFPQFLNRQGNQ